MKLMIQIPCLNEEQTLPLTWAHLPAKLPGIDVIETLIVDDGSTDRTPEVARGLGATHVVRLTGRRGLANAFKEGLTTCLQLGADIIVNTDADNQYYGEDIEGLIRPILSGEADIVIGDRQVASLREFSRTKRLLQRLGSWVIRSLSGLDVPDATSGFRAYSREAALRTNVLSAYTYTHETILQASSKNLKVVSVPVRINPPTRTSRLIDTTLKYVLRSATTILRTYLVYAPLRVFTLAGLLLFAPGGFLVGRFLYYYFATEGPTGYIQSLIIGIGLVIISAFVLLFGIVADLVRINRMLLEDLLYAVRSQIGKP